MSNAVSWYKKKYHQDILPPVTLIILFSLYNEEIRYNNLQEYISMCEVVEIVLRGRRLGRVSAPLAAPVMHKRAHAFLHTIEVLLWNIYEYTLNIFL